MEEKKKLGTSAPAVVLIIFVTTFILKILSCNFVSATTTPAVAGDGAVPTYMQWLSLGDISPRMPVHDVGANDLGDATTSFPFKLPPSLLQPVVGIGYNSSGGMSLEMSYGWGIAGILYATKPRARAHEDDVGFVVGGLISGLLKLDNFDHVDERYILASTMPGYISADFDDAGDEDEDNDTLTIYANGITHTLTYKSGALAYRVDRSMDQRGNYITYTYFSDGRIRKIEYGGGTSDEHNVSVQFGYTANTVTRVSYAGSTEASDYKTFAYHLTTVTIKTKRGSRGNFQRRSAYTLNYTTYDDAVDLLTSFVWEGATSATSRTLASFEYSQFDSTATPTRTSTPGISLSSTGTRSEFFGTLITASQSRQDSGLGDLTGDGLADYLVSCEDPDWDQSCDETGIAWGAYSLDRDTSTGTFDHAASAHTVSVPNPGLMYRSFDETLSSTNRMKTTQMIRDFDGDGKVDVIVAEGDGIFTVYKGLGTGFAYEGDFDDYIYEETGPTRWDAIQVDYTYQVVSGVGTIGLYKGMFDLNSDGFLDLVEAGHVYLHSGTLGGGWESRAVPLSVATSAIQTVEYTIDHFDYGTDTDDTTDNLLTGYDYISEQKETANFYDLNSDGCLDYVSANPTTWAVHYGRCDGTFATAVPWDAPGGYDFISHTIEGLPSYSYSWTDAYGIEQNRTYTGEPSRLIATLIDVNGDGYLDWAGGEEYNSKWWQNTGENFIGPFSLPSWWPDEFSYARASSTSASTGARTSEGFSYLTTSATMLDIDHDNVVDSVTSAAVTYGPYPRPYLLTSVTREQGGITEISYVNSSQLYPAGSGITTSQDMPISKDVVETIAVTDPHTGQTGQIQYDRENGFYENQVFQGFEDVTITTSVNGTEETQTKITNTLSEDFPPLPTDKIIRSNYASGRASFADRYYIHTDYNAGTIYRRLPYIREVTEYGETSGANDYSLTYLYDAWGNLTTVSHNGGVFGGGDQNDTYQIDIYFISDADDRLWVSYAKRVSGHDSLNGDIPRTFVYQQFDYDDLPWGDVDAGLVTAVRTCNNWYVEDGECGIYETTTFNYLSSSYAYGDRGQLTSVTNDDTGEAISYTYGFNDSVLRTITNSLSHRVTNTIDVLGRITDTEDPNGFIQTTAYDDFGRATQLSATDTDGITTTFQSTTYNDTMSPTSVVDSLYTGSSVETDQRVIFDGFGHPSQIWRQTYTGDYAVSNAIFDVPGKAIQSSHPETYGAYTSVPLTITEVFQEVEYDSMGIACEIFADRDYDGSIMTSVSYDEPWKEITTDPSGYEKKLVFDAHGRVIEVWEGNENSGLTQLATYRYDPENRLVKYTDADDNYWNYYYDAAGRLRQVSYGDPSTAETVWYSYTYENGRLRRVEDNTGAYSEITAYDDIGRVTDEEISDGLPTSSTGIISYHLDYDDDWIGALDSAEDENGSVSYEYDSSGRLESATRQYNNGINATFSYQYEDNGRLETTTYPSGRILENEYTYGWLTQQEGKAADATTDYTIDFTYNRWGQLLTATTDKSITYTYSRPSPIRIDNIVMERGAQTYREDYLWYSNGLLQTKSVQIDSTTNEYSYYYNPLKELERVYKNGITQEYFTYDGTGTLTNMTAADGLDWTYGRVGVMGQITDRTSSAGDTVSYIFATNGRVSSVVKAGSTREVYYDGLGRLRGTQRDGTWIEVVDYAADGSIARRADNDPFSATPNYTYSFGAWEFDGSRTETDGPYVTYQGANRIWKMKDYAGTVTVTLPEISRAAYNSMEYSAYGQEINVSGTAWTRETLHGARRDDYQTDLLEMGQRHVFEDDGQWLQPEPMLYMGLTPAAIINPMGLQTYRYAANNPSNFADRNGLWIEDAVIGTASIGLTVASIASWDENTSFGMKALDVGCLAFDIVAVAVPGLPAAAGLANHGAQIATRGVNTAHLAMNAMPSRTRATAGLLKTVYGEAGPRVGGVFSNVIGELFEKAVMKRFGMVRWPQGEKVKTVLGNFKPDFVTSEGNLAEATVAMVFNSRKITQIKKYIADAAATGSTHILYVLKGTKIPQSIQETIRTTKNLVVVEAEMIVKSAAAAVGATVLFSSWDDETDTVTIWEPVNVTTNNVFASPTHPGGFTPSDEAMVQMEGSIMILDGVPTTMRLH